MELHPLWTPTDVVVVGQSVVKPYYRPIANEGEIFRSCAAKNLPVLLKGPTGCGKTRFIEFMASELHLPLISVACNEDTSASDLLGRFLIKGSETIWQDGPVTRAVRQGALLYLDEIAEAREDVVVVLHSLSDHRRELYLDRTGETLAAPKSFQLAVSFNPGYQSSLKDMKPSTRQRFVGIAFTYPPEEIEAEIIEHETACTPTHSKKLVRLASQLRTLKDIGLRETASTRLLIQAAHLIGAGLTPRAACTAAIAHPMTDEPEALAAINDLIALAF